MITWMTDVMAKSAYNPARYSYVLGEKPFISLAFLFLIGKQLETVI